MRTIYCGTLHIDYRTYKKDSNDFESFLQLKRYLDSVFVQKKIRLRKYPKDPTPKFYITYYDFFLDYQSELFYEFFDIMKELSLDKQITYNFEFEFTDKEKRESPLFFMATYFDFYAEDIKHPSEYGTKYEKTFVCPKCGAVKFDQVSPLFWDTGQMKERLLLEIPANRHYGGYSFIITEHLADILQQKNCSGYSLEKVYHVENSAPPHQCYQLFVNHVLPPLSGKTPVLEGSDDCEECGKYGKTKFPLHYDRSSLDNLKDFNRAYEERTYSAFQPRILVSPKVKDLFDSLKIKPVYQPIIVVV